MIGRLISTWLASPPAESRKAFWAFLYTSFVVASFFTLKPVRDAQFLSQVGAGKLPYLYMGLGLFLAGAAAGIAHLLKGLPMGRVVTTLTTVAIGTNLGTWSVSLFHSGPWFNWAFYLWVALMGLILPLYGWLLWSECFTVREARRLYWLIALGGPFGAFLGSLMAGLAVSALGTDSLVPLAVLHLAAGLWVLGRVRSLCPDLWKYYSPALLQLPGRQFQFRLLSGSDYLPWIMAAVFLTEFSSTWIEFLFQSALQRHLGSAAEMARFLSWFYSGTSLLGLLVQVLAARALIQGLGLRWTLAILPFTLGLLSIGLPLLPLFAGLALLRGFDISFRHTVQRTSLELLYFPISQSLKEAVRGPFETLSQRSGMAFAGLGLLAASPFISRGGLWPYVPLWTALFLLVLLSRRLHRKYVEALKSSFKRPMRGKTPVLDPFLADPDLRDKLAQALRSPEESVVVNAMDFIEVLNQQDLVWPHFAEHPSPQVRLKALRLSPFWNVDAIRKTVSPLLSDPIAEVRAEAVHLACSLNGEEASRLVAPHLDSPDPVVRSQAAACLAGRPGPRQHEAVRIMEEMCRSDDARTRRETVAALPVLEAERVNAMLSRLLEDKDEGVLALAVECAGTLASPDHLTRLFKLLARSRLRPKVEEALARYGERILGTLEDYLKDPAVAAEIRQSVPAVLGRIRTPRSAALLLDTLKAPDVKQRFRALKALNRLKRDLKDISLDKARIRQAVVFECEWHRHLSSDIDGILLLGSSAPSAKLLTDHLREHRNWTMERIFRLLGMIHKQRDVHRAYLGYASDSPRQQAYSIEFLDNVLDGDLRQMLMPLLEKPSHFAGKETRPDSSASTATLLEILEHPDPAAVALSLSVLGSRFPETVPELLPRFHKNPDPLVQEVLHDFDNR